MPHTPPISLDKDFNPGNARWCDKHERLECTKTRRHGRGDCHGRALRGLNGCRLHAGVSPQVAEVKGEAMITAWSAIGTPGSVTIDYKMAVLGVLQMTYLRLSKYGELLRRQVEGDAADGEGLYGAHAGLAPSFGAGRPMVTGELLAEDGTPLELPAAPSGTEGLIGHRYGMGGKDGIVYVQNEEVRALVALEAAERDRVVRYSEVAHKMGISDRLTALAERWGDVVAGRVTDLLEALELTPEQQARVPELIAQHLSSIDMASAQEIDR